jgi:disulfide bond formation protein DsbB
MTTPPGAAASAAVSEPAPTASSAAAPASAVSTALPLYLAWIVSITAMAGSLYFSEVRAFVPCALCWWQRILMYPLVIVLGVATFRQDRAAWRYALPLAALGLATSTYHYLVQKVPGIGRPASCALGVPCDVQYVNYFGFVTIPFMAGVAFLLITLALLSVARAERRSATPR